MFFFSLLLLLLMLISCYQSCANCYPCRCCALLFFVSLCLPIVVVLRYHPCCCIYFMLFLYIDTRLSYSVDDNKIYNIFEFFITLQHHLLLYVVSIAISTNSIDVSNFLFHLLLLMLLLMPFVMIFYFKF